MTALVGMLPMTTWAQRERKMPLRAARTGPRAIRTLTGESTARKTTLERTYWIRRRSYASSMPANTRILRVSMPRS